MPASIDNLLADIAPAGLEEVVTPILERPGVRIERIVSLGHTTPAGQIYEQAGDEWVMVVEGKARLWLEGQGEVAMGCGDHLLIPAGLRHRVTWTTPDAPTVWLAVHMER